MALAITEEMSVSLQRGFSEWWNEETEYIFQRIERWAAIARGYNRLRSQRLSRGRLTMQEDQEPRWSISSNKMVIEDPNWSPRFSNLRRSHRRKLRNEENCRINCCDSLNYQSGCNLDSNCLDNYRYDHSIYFKTIGDIKGSKIGSSRSSENEENSDDERAQWQVKSPTEIFRQFCIDENKRVSEDDEYDDDEEFDECSEKSTNFGRNVKNLLLDSTCSENEAHRDCHESIVPEDQRQTNKTAENKQKLAAVTSEVSETRGDKNNNSLNEREVVVSTEKMIQLQINQLTANQLRLDSNIDSSTTEPASAQKSQNGFFRITSMRRSRKNTRKAQQTMVAGENNVLWPGVLLSYTKNVDNNSMSPHHYRAVQVK